jgi:hypothetical protein
MLSARDVETALRERILFAAYPRGGPLPSVRALATNAGRLPQRLAGRARRLLRVGWTLEGNPW